ncbi:hypothetical protein E9232_005108 [Inquilinus ginsengisoli]|uniref:DUF4236 domain-containing protein n=1 Tax=Inquilinus ginsengisoli TaxID=363840 RepID=A0ABU1JW69_9PROT|nr:hypothetical protein [Inquilinus ginsengisoli]
MGEGAPRIRFRIAGRLWSVGFGAGIGRGAAGKTTLRRNRVPAPVPHLSQGDARA